MSLIFSQELIAQERAVPSNSEIRISYLSHYFTEPGIRLGYLHHFNKYKSEHQKINSFVIHPSFSFFSRPRYHSSYLANMDFGFKKNHPTKEKYHAFGLGYGYLLQYDVTTLHVDFQGKISKSREMSPFHLATVHWESGIEKQNNLHWFYKISAGQKFSSEREGATVILLEFGLKKRLSKQQ